MGIAIAGIVPHPPIIIPKIGRGELKRVHLTVESLKSFSSQVAASAVETVIIITPHGAVFSDAPTILADEKLRGDFGKFRAPDVEVAAPNDLELVRAIEKSAAEEGIDVVLLGDKGLPATDTSLDHGAAVPLYYLQQAGVEARCVSINYAMLPYRELFRFGEAVHSAVHATGRKVAVLASGDLSHRLTKDAPAGYSPRGVEFDEKLVACVRDYRVQEILEMDEALVTAAGECGMRSFAILLGCLSGLNVKPEVLSYEGPFGVGYMVAQFIPRESGEVS